MQLDFPNDRIYNPNRLLLTQRGRAWLNEFDLEDQDIARKLVSGLTLVPSRTFELAINKKLQEVIDSSERPVALFAVREVDPSCSFFDQATNLITIRRKTIKSVDAVGRGADVGSEGRVASIITQFTRSKPQRTVKHPTLDNLRKRRCRTIILVDDLIGSGNRMEEFIESIWKDRTIRSWNSFGLIRLKVVAFAATTHGRRRIGDHENIDCLSVERDCPTFRTLPWKKDVRNACIRLCEKYASRTCWPKFAQGYGKSISSLVFEHGCPNNVPAIFWATKARTKSWSPIFPYRRIETDEQTVFPPEIAKHDPLSVLVDVGQIRLARTRLIGRSELTKEIITLLALIAKGIRRNDAFSFATGLSNATLERKLLQCIECGWVTHSRRITALGVAELNNARRSTNRTPEIPSKGDCYYHPSALREISRG